MIGVLNHEMRFQWQIRLLAHGRDQSGAKRNVVYEMTIHDVAMDAIRAGRDDLSNIFAELGKVSGQNGWSHANHWSDGVTE
jgi:hypothetical protein